MNGFRHILAMIVWFAPSAAAYAQVADGMKDDLPIGLPSPADAETSPLDMGAAEVRQFDLELALRKPQEGIIEKPVSPLDDFIAGTQPKPKEPVPGLGSVGIMGLPETAIARPGEETNTCDGATPVALRTEAEWEAQRRQYRARIAEIGCPPRPGWIDDYRKAYCAQIDPETLFDCSRAAIDLIDFRTALTGSQIRYMQHVGEISSCRGLSYEAAQTTYRELTRRFVQACVSTVVVDAPPSGLTGKAWRQIMESVGVLVDAEGRSPPCTGFLAHGMVITARHCLATGMVIADDLSRYLFTTLAGTVYSGFDLQEVRSAGDYRDKDAGLFLAERPESDVVGMTFKATLLPGLEIGDPIPGEPLFMVGMNQNPVNLATNFGDLPARDLPAASFFALDNGVACRVRYVSEAGCMIHGCQTDNLSSGAPLLALRGGVPVVVGVQAGTLDTGEFASCQAVGYDLAGRLSNYAVKAAAILR